MPGRQQKRLRLTIAGNVVIHVMECGKASFTRLTELYYTPLLARKIVSYGKLELKGYKLKYKNNRRALISLNTGSVVFDVAMCNNVVHIETQEERPDERIAQAVIAAINEAKNNEVDEGVHSGTLMNYHQHLGHLSNDTIENMAREPTSGIRLTDNERVMCVTCAQAKQSKSAQSKKDTGVH